MSALEKLHHRNDGLRIGREPAEPRSNITIQCLHIHEIKVDVRVNQLERLHALVAGGIPDDRQMQTVFPCLYNRFDDRGDEVGPGYEIDGSSSERLKLKHQFGKLPACQFHPVPASTAYLVVLTELTMQRTAAEEDHPRALLP